MSRRLAFPVVLAALAFPAGAAAAPPWSAPATPAQPEGQSAIAPGLAFARDGGILAFSADADPSRPASPRQGQIARVAQSGLGFTRRLPPGEEIVGAPQAYGATRTLTLTRRRTGGEQFTTGDFRIGVRFGRVDDTLDTRATVLDRDVPLDVFDPPVLAANARGDAVAAWIATPGNGRSRLWVALRRAGGSFGRPSVLVGTGSLSQASVAVGERGDLVVAFQRTVDGERRVQARVRRAGHSFGALDDLGVSRGRAFPDATMTRTGRAYVAWQTFDVGEEVNEPTRVYAAVKPAGPRRFRTAQLLDAGDATGGVDGTVAVAAAEDGTATVAWNGKVGGGEGTTFPVRVATTDARAVFGAGRALAGGAGQLRDVAVAADGTAAVAWSATASGSFEGAALTAAVRPAGAPRFGAPETISAEPAGVTEAAVLAFPVGGAQPVAAWLVRDGARRATVRVARRG